MLKSRSFLMIAICAPLLMPPVADAQARVSTEGSQSPSINGNDNKIIYGASETRSKSPKPVRYPPETADKFAAKWLGLLDSGNYKAAYFELHPMNRASISEEQFIQSMAAQRRVVGAVRGRKWVAGGVVNPPQSRLPDKPEFGAYFKTNFQDARESDEISEIIGIGQREDGKWSVVEYQCVPCQR